MIRSLLLRFAIPFGVLAALVALAPIAPAQPQTEVAAAQLRPLLDPPARLAATAVLIHERTGRYPQTVFELLGSPEAERTGVRRLRLARLDVTTDADSLRLRFLLTPTAEEPTERGGTVALASSDDGYTAPFRLVHREDPDFADEALPVAEAHRFRVRSARGTLCIDPAHLDERIEEGTFVARLPFLHPTESLTVRFTTTGGARPAGRVVLTPSSP